MKIGLRRRFLLAALVAYSLCLICAAWPAAFLPQPMRTIQSSAYWFLADFLISPGLKLFYRPYNEIYKMRGECIEFKGESKERIVTTLYSSHSGCHPETESRWKADTYDLMYHRLLEEALLERLALLPSQGNGVFKSHQASTVRESAVYQALGAFFCAPQHTGSVPMKAVEMMWRRDKVDSRSGETGSSYELITRWSCETASLQTVEWQPYVFLRDIDGFIKGEAW